MHRLAQGAIERKALEHMRLCHAYAPTAKPPARSHRLGATSSGAAGRNAMRTASQRAAMGRALSRSRSLPFPHPRLLPPSPHDSARVGATARCRHLPRHALQAEPLAPIASVIEERAARHLGAMARAARALLRLAVIRRAVEAQPARATRVDINCHSTHGIS